MDYQSKITIDAATALRDLRALTKALQSNQKHMDALNKSSIALNKALKANSTNVSKLNTQTKALNTSMKNAASNTSKLVTQTKYLNTSIKNNIKSVGKLTTQTKYLNTSIKSNTASIKKLAISTKLLNTSIKSNISSTNTLNTSLKANSISIKKNSADLVKLSATMNTLSSAVAKSVVGMSKLVVQTKFLSESTKRNSANLSKLSTTMVALGTATNKSVVALSSFNKNSTMLNASLKANTLAVNNLASKMMLLSTNTNISSVATVRHTKVTKVAAANNIMLGNSIGFINKFLKVQLVLFRTAMLAATAYMGAKLYIEFNKTAESIDLMNRKLETFTGSQDAFELVKRSAFKSGIAVQDLGKIITRLAITTEGAFSTKTLARWTEGLVMSARAAGTSTMEMNNAMIQLSQSFSAGFLMGDEYRSISENLPLFKLALRDVADEAGLAGQSLKELSSGRKIDIDLMTKALEKLSKESVNYTFALDNIEAAEQRVKIGWDLFANSVANTRTVKDSLNELSGILVNIANDGAGMEAFADNFPEMNRDIQDITSSLFQLYDTSGLVYDEWVRFFSLNSNWDAIAHTVKVLLDLMYDGWNKMPITLNTIIDILSAEWKMGTESWGALFLKFGAVVVKVFDQMKAYASLITESISSIFNSMWNVITKGIQDKFKFIGSILSNFDLTKTTGESFKNVAEEIKGMVGTSKNLTTIYEEHKVLYDQIGNKEKERQKELNNQISSAKVLFEKERDIAFVKDESSKKEFDRKVKLKGLARDAQRVAALTLHREAVKREEGIEDKGLKDRKLKDAAALRKYNSAIKKATKDLVKFKEEQRELNDEISKLKNPFDKSYDSFDDIVDLEEQIERLANARKYNVISQSEYNKEVTKTIEQTKELIALKEEEAINKLSRSYDEVKAVTYEYEEVQYDLNILLEKGKISAYAYADALYEAERALIAAKSKSGELAQDEQFFKGLSDGLYDFSHNSKTVFEEMSELTTKSFNSMTDELTEFVTTGKADFKGLVDSIVKDLTRIAIQKSITEPLADALFGSLGGSSSILSSVFGGGSASSMISGQTGFTGGASGVLSGAEFLTFSNGSSFNNGNIQAFAKGTVLNSPTLFPMSDGTGLMAEDGPEAIMPLKRGKDGKLGVAASEGSQDIYITINVQGTEGNPEAIRRSAGQVAQAAGNAANRAVRRNG